MAARKVLDVYDPVLCNRRVAMKILLHPKMSFKIKNIL